MSRALRVRRIETGSKTGALDEDVRGRVRDARLLAAHDAGDGHRLLLVGDDEHVRAERDVPAFERPERLALLRPADDDPAAADLGQVEGVDGLAGGEEDVVGRVDDVVDRT